MYSGAMAATIGSARRGVATVTRPAPDLQRAARRQVRRAGLADRSRHDQHAAEVALVRVRRPRLDQLPHALARQQLDVRALERVQHLRRDADVGDDQVPGQGSAGGSTSGSLGAASVTVSVASIDGPMTW